MSSIVTRGVFIVMYRIRNLYRKSSLRSCPYTVLVKCPVRFYNIFDEIGQNVDGKMYFYHKSHCSTTTTESNGSGRQRFQFTCARERICAEKLRRTFFRPENLILVPRAPTFFFKLLNDPTADQKIVGSGNEDAANKVKSSAHAGRRKVLGLSVTFEKTWRPM